MEKEVKEIDSSPKYNKIVFNNYDLIVLSLTSIVDNVKHFHVSAECLSHIDNMRYENMKAKFFEKEEDAINYFDTLYNYYSTITELQLENELKSIK